MKRIGIITLILISVQSFLALLNAQIGINTETPLGILHIDAQRNTPEIATGSGPLILDDIIVSHDGNLGLGTLTPENKLHVVTGGTAASPVVGVRIVDGGQGVGKVLTSDADGFASWKDVQPMPTAVAVKVGAAIPSSTTSYYNTNTYIKLPPGRWKVTATTLISNDVRGKVIHDKIWGHSMFTESTAAIATAMSPDVEGGKVMAALLTKYSFNVMIGSVVINNKTTATKTYYYALGAFNPVGDSVGNDNFLAVAGTLNNENSIVATLIQD